MEQLLSMIKLCSILPSHRIGFIDNQYSGRHHDDDLLMSINNYYLKISRKFESRMSKIQFEIANIYYNFILHLKMITYFGLS